MDKRDSIIQVLEEQGVMPLFFHSSDSVSIKVMHALYTAGIRLIEYTNRGPEALANFTAMRKVAETELPGLYLGTGTIKDENAGNKFIDAGADFLISPALAEDVYDLAYSNKILWIPGCMTPTEILKAEQFGLSLVKIFPGNILGPSYVEAIKDIFPSMKFMPTGGVTTEVENLSKWFKAGVYGVGLGSKLISTELLRTEGYETITSEATKLLSNVRNIKQQLNS